MHRNPLTRAKVPLRQRFQLRHNGISGEGGYLLTVECSIPRMRSAGATASGTVRWSVLLLTGRETVLTRLGFGLEGSVRQMLPVRYASPGLVAGAIL